MIYYLMGKSASGKDSIYRRILEELPQLRRVILYTTRPKRSGETDGVEYRFIDDAEFFRLKEAGRLIEYREYNTVHGIWRYATVDDGQTEPDRYDYLMIGTLESYAAARKYYGSDKLCPVYVTVDDGERLIRAIRREQSQEKPQYAEMCRRFLADEEDFSAENLAKNGIDREFRNDVLEDCIEEIRELIAGGRNA